VPGMAKHFGLRASVTSKRRPRQTKSRRASSNGRAMTSTGSGRASMRAGRGRSSPHATPPVTASAVGRWTNRRCNAIRRRFVNSAFQSVRRRWIIGNLGRSRRRQPRTSAETVKPGRGGWLPTSTSGRGRPRRRGCPEEGRLSSHSAPPWSSPRNIDASRKRRNRVLL
jgi:hypothetical protein